MTHEELQAIKARAEAATPGPWHRGFGNSSQCTREDGDFIAHARTDVPALVAEVERLRAIVKAMMNALPEPVWRQIAIEHRIDYVENTTPT